MFVVLLVSSNKHYNDNSRQNILAVGAIKCRKFKKIYKLSLYNSFVLLA